MRQFKVLKYNFFLTWQKKIVAMYLAWRQTSEHQLGYRTLGLGQTQAV